MLVILERQMHMDPAPAQGLQGATMADHPPLVVIIMFSIWGWTALITGRALLAANNVHRPYHSFMAGVRKYWRKMMLYYYY
eukprot:2898159-Pyramimonas_sp.AAC.1